MSAHTPGPWEFTTRPDSGGESRPVVTQGSELICAVSRRDGQTAESDANARLIAKSPELLELVRGVVGLERRKLLKDKGARAWVGACEALLAELGELPPRQEVDES